MPYVWHTAWPPGAADGCLFGLFHREQVEDATSMYQRIGPGVPGCQSGFLSLLFEPTLAETEVMCGRLRSGFCLRSPYPI